ncbi:hypothetical protein MIND_00024400 [Mycena indigotica]|uniref:EF-hand domain-containing protein n=1 Tax=Mycena indigotica TaxID=2126181 RepID=A0A8H6TEA2_9AGAR|nr:uncharacterized protein MIND_00024400 [Mycena indigotica]KAF7315102.1 hypothetical protein MIND_00024400 [Mycena indigotica]
MTSFSVLPPYLQKRVDKAFDLCAESELDHATSTASGGGFVLEAPEPMRIALSSIPAALQRLDLPPDDEQVLNVFKNAATGWSSATNEVNHNPKETELFVSRDDWHSVCAVLLEHHAEEYGESASEGRPFDDDDEGDAYEDVEDSDDSDEYMDEDDLGPSTSSRRRRPNTRRRASSSESSHSSSPKKLTARQRKTCLDTFALFFPDVDPKDLVQQRVMIKDVQRLTQLIGDKLKSEEIVEMVEEFSTSPDKSMSFDDFSVMMLAAKLA